MYVSLFLLLQDIHKSRGNTINSTWIIFLVSSNKNLWKSKLHCPKGVFCTEYEINGSLFLLLFMTLVTFFRLQTHKITSKYTLVLCSESRMRQINARCLNVEPAGRHIRGLMDTIQAHRALIIEPLWQEHQ